jgi:hypothetical protein
VNSVCIASHDAGGAEILACYVAQNALRCRLVLEGPAVKVFERHLGAVRAEPLADAIAASAWCLFGTSWQSDLEWRAIAQARRAGKRVVSFLDHWINYRERFVRDGVEHLPDELWVGDEDAEALAKKHFPRLPVRLVPNPYFAYVERELARYGSRRREAGSAARVLFVAENISAHARLRFGDERHWGYTEFDAIEHFFRRIRDLGAVERVVLRPHPSDPAHKYAHAVSEHAPLAQMGGGRPLLEEIAEADVVTGCESVALVAALRAGKRVICSIPPGGEVQYIHRCRGVEMLRDLPSARERRASS